MAYGVFHRQDTSACCVVFCVSVLHASIFYCHGMCPLPRLAASVRFLWGGILVLAVGCLSAFVSIAYISI